MSKEARDSFLLCEKSTHRKLVKQLLALVRALEDPADLSALDKVCMLTTMGEFGRVVPVPNRLAAYPTLRLCVEEFAHNETNGTNIFYSRLRLGKDLMSQGIPQEPDYCSVVYIASDRTHSKPEGLTHVDFHWFLLQDKALAVILAPGVCESAMSTVIHAFIDDNGLLQKFRVCNTCGKKGGSVWLCPYCTKVGYCDRACQKADWASHKAVCKKVDLSGAIDKIDKIAISQVCVVCGSGSLKACACKTLYCGTACRDSDWPNHKKVCKKLQASKSTCSKCKKPTVLKQGGICPKCALK